MNRKVAALVMIFAAGLVVEVGARQTQAPASTANWKNLQVLTELKSQPESALYDTMDFIAGSLGVGCNNCHFGGFDGDSKPAKTMARTMIKMTRAINDSHFGGRPVVTCQTCHQGHATPNGVPSPWYSTPEQLAAERQAAAAQQAGAASPPPAPAPVALPSASVVLDNYRKAVGAMSPKTLRITGTSADRFLTARMDMVFVSPDQARLTITNSTGQTNEQIANHDHGWLASPNSRTAMPANQPARFLTAVKSWLLLPAALMSPTAAVTGTARVGSRTCYVVQSDSVAGVERLYFDTESALLLKARREITTPLGVTVHDTEFTDYHDVNGVQRPGRMLDHLMGDEVDYTITDIQIDGPVDAAIFEPRAPKVRVAITLAPAALDAVAGKYQLRPGNVATITHEGAQLFLTQANGIKLEVFAESASDFFLKDAPVQLNFVKSPSGDVTTMIVHQNGAVLECPRVSRLLRFERRS